LRLSSHSFPSFLFIAFIQSIVLVVSTALQKLDKAQRDRFGGLESELLLDAQRCSAAVAVSAAVDGIMPGEESVESARTVYASFSGARLWSASSAEGIPLRGSLTPQLLVPDSTARRRADSLLDAFY
jgi:hypothetical protein